MWLKTIEMKQLSSYQKLKQENQKLKQDIYYLVRERDKDTGLITELKYEILYKMSDVLWFGDATNDLTFKGIIQ